MPDYSNIKLIVLDVDGTLTDGGIYYDAQGNELKRFDVKDGLGIKVGIAAGLEFAIITGRVSPMVERRAKELGIQHMETGVQVKLPALKKLAAACRLSMNEIGYFGDDLNDLQAMQHVGYRACPSDAAKEVRDLCDYISELSGGHGAVRDCIEALLSKQGRWSEAITRQYFLE